MSKQRVLWIDVAKGILITLVVVGHSHINPVVDAVISSFHMAGFFILSGITFYAKRKFFGGNFLNRKIKSIIFPYFLFCTLLLAQKYLTARFITHTDVNLIDGIISVFVPISGRDTTTVYGLWFLPCLFLSEIILYFFIKLKNRKKIFSYIYIGLVFVLCLVLYFETSTVSVITLLPFSCLFIIIGTQLKKCINWIQNRKLWVLIGSAVLFLLSFIINVKLSSLSFDFSSMTMGIIPLYIVCCIFGSLVLFCVSMFIEKSKIFNVIGKNSIYYYGFHYEILAVLKEVIPYKMIQPFATIVILIPIVAIYLWIKNKLLEREK